MNDKLPGCNTLLVCLYKPYNPWIRLSDDDEIMLIYLYIVLDSNNKRKHDNELTRR